MHYYFDTHYKFKNQFNDHLFTELINEKSKLKLDIFKPEAPAIELVEPFHHLVPKALPPPLGFYARNIKPIFDTISAGFFYLAERILTIFRAIFCCLARQEKEAELENPILAPKPNPKPPLHDPKIHFKAPPPLQYSPIQQKDIPPQAVVQPKIVQKPDPLIKKQEMQKELQQSLIAETNEWWKGIYSADQLNRWCDDYIKQAVNLSYILRKSTSDQSQKYTLHYKKDNITHNVRLEITPAGKLSISGQEATYTSLADLKKALGLRISVNLQTLKTFQNQTTLEQYLLNWKQDFSDVSELTYAVQLALLENNGPHFFLRKSENQAHVFYLSYKKDQQIIEEKLTLQANGTLQIPSQRNRVFQNFKELSQAVNLGTSLTLKDINEAKALLIRHAPTPEEFLKEPQAFLDPQEEGEIEEAQGPRTLGMYSYLHGFKAFDSTTKQLTLQGKTYTPVTGGTTQLSQKRLISCGSSISREAIVLDPEDSPILNDHFDKLLQQIQAKQHAFLLTEEQIIDEVIRYVRQNIFPSCTDRHLEYKVNRFVQDKWGSSPALYYQQDGKQGYIPAIPIDEFIKADIGVCRHHGLVTGYLLDRLTREPAQRPILQGVPQVIRDNITNGAHVWATFMSAQGKKWHIDTLWPVKEEFSQPQGIQSLQNGGYRIAAIQNQIRRTQWAHKLATEGNEKKKACKKALDLLTLNLLNLSVNRLQLVLFDQPQDYVIRQATSEPYTYVLHYWDGMHAHQKRFTIQQDGAIRLSQQMKTYQDLADMIAKLDLKQCLTRADIDNKLQALAAA